MTARKLDRIAVPKPWGQRNLPAFVAGGDGCPEPIGEIWYSEPDGKAARLLLKLLFTSERISIQVHPDDEQARRLGFSGGKEEAWVVLHAEPGATIGLGLTRTVSSGELRRAALDGTIEELVHWRTVSAGDFFHVPPGTIHALGGGLVVAEVQDNVDATLRLYDYGRPRELQLDEALQAAHAGLFRHRMTARPSDALREVLVQSGRMVLERWGGVAASGRLEGADPVWVLSLGGSCRLDDLELRAGEAALSKGPTRIATDEDTILLVAYAGSQARSFPMQIALAAPPVAVGAT